MSVPTLLALAATALMALGIFATNRSSLADRATTEEPPPPHPRWPELVEPSATYCDVGARLDLVDALASIGSPWALGVLHQAGDDETDPMVQAAIASALESSRTLAPAASPGESLVT